MKLRHAVTLALMGLAIISAILIYVSTPRYYLIVLFPEKPIVQVGPFATQTACESARHRIAEVLYERDPASKKDIEDVADLWTCVASR